MTSESSFLQTRVNLPTERVVTTTPISNRKVGDGSIDKGDGLAPPTVRLDPEPIWLQISITATKTSDFVIAGCLSNRSRRNLIEREMFQKESAKK
jgi:hypothetical protein